MQKDLKSKNEKTAEAQRRRNANRVNHDLRRAVDDILAAPLEYSDEELARIYRHTRDHAAARLAVLVTADDNFKGAAVLQGIHDGAVRALQALLNPDMANAQAGPVSFGFSSAPNGSEPN
jgi:hypothetical protein